MSASPLLIEDIVRRTLTEDLGHGFDVTSDSVVAAGTVCRAVINTREAGILAGLIPALTAFSLTDPGLDLVIYKQDGDPLAPGETIAEVEGNARSILTAERTALNFLAHLSGVATRTAEFVNACLGTDAKICCTRKTLPGLRALQKAAVRSGGGINHRFGLDDAILIKDNHIALAGGIVPALENAKTAAGILTKIEIEVETLDQLDAVLKTGLADGIMFDNMPPDDMEKAVRMVRDSGKPVFTEASGGVSLETVRAIAETGVDYISIGGLTHSVRALDCGLDIEEET